MFIHFDTNKDTDTNPIIDKKTSDLTTSLSPYRCVCKPNNVNIDKLSIMQSMTSTYLTISLITMDINKYMRMMNGNQSMSILQINTGNGSFMLHAKEINDLPPM